MTFDEWVEKNWRFLETEEEEYRAIFCEMKEIDVSNILAKFNTKPSQVVLLPRQSLEKLPWKDKWFDLNLIEDWIDDNIEGCWYIFNITTYFFEKEEDAMKFKLAWV